MGLCDTLGLKHTRIFSYELITCCRNSQSVPFKDALLAKGAVTVPVKTIIGMNVAPLHYTMPYVPYVFWLTLQRLLYYSPG
jgi:hypothetical protein